MRKIVYLFILFSVVSHADVRPSHGEHTFYAFLAMNATDQPKLVVNPLTTSSYVIDIQNPETLNKLMQTKEFVGWVKATVEISSSADSHGTGVVKKIKASKPSHPLAYDGDMREVPRR